MIKISDFIIELGPNGGKDGGSVVFQGWFNEFLSNNRSLTNEFVKKGAKFKLMEKSNWFEKSHDSWSVFKVMGEIVEGYERLSKIGPCVSIFGSARTSNKDFYYKETIKLAELISKKGLGIITGGGPGIMEAANKGAKNSGGISVGLNIKLPFEQEPNKFIDKENSIDFDYFFVRKIMFEICSSLCCYAWWLWYT